jgi:2,4-dienoyl-CoA reductase-like NADH-dependent reductase (Old Yellow Enzyme family)
VAKEAYFKEEAAAFKKAINIPLILVGGIRSFEVAQQLVTEGTADYISMSRPFIWEPDLIKRWQAGDRRKAECNSDNLCFKPVFKGGGLYCVTRERNQAKSDKP